MKHSFLGALISVHLNSTPVAGDARMDRRAAGTRDILRTSGKW